MNKKSAQRSLRVGVDENGHCLFPGDRLQARVRGMQEAGGAGAASVWTQQARAAGSSQGARHHSHTRKHHGGEGGTGPMHATPRRLNVNTDTSPVAARTHTHWPLGPIPQLPITQVPGTVQSDPRPHLPQPTGSLA